MTDGETVTFLATVAITVDDATGMMNIVIRQNAETDPVVVISVVAPPGVKVEVNVAESP